jgi:hypothetical protein
LYIIITNFLGVGGYGAPLGKGTPSGVLLGLGAFKSPFGTPVGSPAFNGISSAAPPEGAVG